MDNLERELCEIIIDRCKLRGIDLDNYDYDAPLFISEDEEVENGMELDSVDALEIVAGVKKQYGITINVNDVSIFHSINTLADYVRNNKDN